MENFDLFKNIDLSEDDFVSPSESVEPQTKNENNVVQASIDLFGEQPVPIVPQDIKPTVTKTVEVKPKEETPVVPVKTVKTNKKPAKSKAKGPSELTKKLMEQKKKKEDITITPEWTVAYSANQYHVPHNMKVEEVREWMEVDYPELSKERTTWSIDESKQLLVPIVSGAKKG